MDSAKQEGLQNIHTQVTNCLEATHHFTDRPKDGGLSLSALGIKSEISVKWL